MDGDIDGFINAYLKALVNGTLETLLQQMTNFFFITNKTAIQT